MIAVLPGWLVHLHPSTPLTWVAMAPTPSTRSPPVIPIALPPQTVPPCLPHPLDPPTFSDSSLHPPPPTATAPRTGSSTSGSRSEFTAVPRTGDFFWAHFRLRKFPNKWGQRSSSYSKPHTPRRSSLAAAEI